MFVLNLSMNPFIIFLLGGSVYDGIRTNQSIMCEM